MADRIELFERRNRLRIVALVFLATLDYIVAVVMTAIALGIAVALAVIFYGGDVFSDTDTFVFFAIFLTVVAVGSAVIGILVGLFRIPFLRRRLERRVLSETGARVVAADEQTEVRNLLEGLAIASGLPPPRVAVIDEPAPNSFGVGTRPTNTVIGVTTGLGERLSRDELEAVLAYEVSRIRSWDVALSSWAVALTSGAISAVDDSEGDNLLKAVLGFVPRRLAESLQVWALRDQGIERDRVAVQFTRNPLSLISALEKLDADSSTIQHVSRPQDRCGSSSPLTCSDRFRRAPHAALPASCCSTNASTTCASSPATERARSRNDAHASRPDQEAHDDEQNAPDDLAPEERDDAGDDVLLQGATSDLDRRPAGGASAIRPAGMHTGSLAREELIAVTKLDMENAEHLAKAEHFAKEAGKQLAIEAVEVGRKRIRRRAERRGRKLERRLEKAAKRLPIDTPVDKRRRRRTAGRTAWIVRIVLASAVIAAIYFAWRARNRRDGTAEAGPAPDAFGAAVEASEDGEQASTVTSPEG